jgi:mannosyltransferase OCH1-like enzyme
VLVADANLIIPRQEVFRYKNKNQFGHGQGSVAGFSDIFRYKLLYDYGGWWVDMDVTCLKQFYFEKPYFFRKHHNLNVVGNIMKCPKGSNVMKRCYEEAKQEVNEFNTDWHKPIEILNENVNRFKLEKYIVQYSSNEDRWDVTSRYVFSSPQVPSEWSFIHWQNEEWRNQNLKKNYFHHEGLLSKLLSAYLLYEPPKNRLQELINEFNFNPFVRKIKRILKQTLKLH